MYQRILTVISIGVFLGFWGADCADQEDEVSKKSEYILDVLVDSVDVFDEEDWRKSNAAPDTGGEDWPFSEGVPDVGIGIKLCTLVR